MVGRPQVVATAEQLGELRTLSRSDRRDEADRARAILLSLEGWASARLGAAFGVGADKRSAVAGLVCRGRRGRASGLPVAGTLGGPWRNLAHAWAKQGADLRIEAPGQSRKVAMLGVQDAVTGQLIVETSATKRSTDFIALLERIDREFGPKPGVRACQEFRVRAGIMGTKEISHGPTQTADDTRCPA